MQGSNNYVLETNHVSRAYNFHPLRGNSLCHLLYLHSHPLLGSTALLRLHRVALLGLLNYARPPTLLPINYGRPPTLLPINYGRPPTFLPINFLLLPSLNLHLPQIRLLGFRSSQSRSSPSSASIRFTLKYFLNCPSLIHSYYTSNPFQFFL